ncbi:MAG: hypothetical protein GEV03_14555 [Streptosporangiales bacterium]|nr:hypothetical protein [Streptosporangiales bacterium]
MHVGAPKTGTTYIQDVLWTNRPTLRHYGVLYPGPGYSAHFHAAMDLQNSRFQGYEDPAVPGAWDRLVEQARAWDGTVIVSHELLSVARPEHVERAMETLGFAEIHVIYTARSLARQIPAAWQEDVKNRGTMAFEDFVRAVHDPEQGKHKPGTKSFWRMQDATNVLERWGRHLPRDRVHVVTVPPPGAAEDELWRRFAGLVGLDPERYDTTAGGGNKSLGATEANLLRRVNVLLRGQVGWPVYDHLVKQYLAQNVLVQRPDATKIVLPPEEHPWVAKRSEEIVDGLRSAGYHIVGDLDELLLAPPRDDERPRQPEDVTDQEMLDAAVDAIAGLVIRARRQSGPIPQASDAVRRVVRDLSERHRSVMRLRRLYWKSRDRTARPRS